MPRAHALERVGRAAVLRLSTVNSFKQQNADAGYYADESFSGDEMQIIVGKAEKIGRGLAKCLRMRRNILNPCGSGWLQGVHRLTA